MIFHKYADVHNYVVRMLLLVFNYNNNKQQQQINFINN